jgi:hypothetical protein
MYRTGYPANHRHELARHAPGVDLNTVVSLIASTHSRAGLRVRAEIDRGAIPPGSR